VTCTSIYTRAVRSKQEVGQTSENARVRLGIKCTHALMLCVCLMHSCLLGKRPVVAQPDRQGQLGKAGRRRVALFRRHVGPGVSRSSERMAPSSSRIAVLGNFHNGGSRVSPAQGLRIITLTGMLGATASRPATKHSARLLMFLQPRPCLVLMMLIILPYLHKVC
jgi:hypothetical protein